MDFRCVGFRPYFIQSVKMDVNRYEIEIDLRNILVLKHYTPFKRCLITKNLKENFFRVTMRYQWHTLMKIFLFLIDSLHWRSSFFVHYWWHECVYLIGSPKYPLYRVIKLKILHIFSQSNTIIANVSTEICRLWVQNLRLQLWRCCCKHVSLDVKYFIKTIESFEEFRHAQAANNIKFHCNSINGHSFPSQQPNSFESCK